MGHLKANSFCKLAALLLLFTTSSFAADNIFEIKPVADKVYAAIARPTFRLNCNAAIILLDDGVLVVDSEGIPAAAREVIADIKHITPLPVKYLVITHFHGDHFQGADAYVKEWPSVQVISSEATRESLLKRGIPRLKRETLGLPARIKKLKSDLAQATDAKQKDWLKKSLDEGEAYYAELKNLNLIVPSAAVDQTMDIHSGSRTVQISWLGRAHTDGDLFVYVPDAKVIVTGDSLHSGTPTFTDASPYDWIRTLDSAEKLDFEYVIGGHGEVMHGKETFELWKRYFTDLLGVTADAVAMGKSLAETQNELRPILIEKYGAKFGEIPNPFAQTVDANIERAFRTIAGPFAQ
jgi:glyoxylase-like metal-dependent hydrolase (beta-lactamase superfamily II)